MAQQYVIIVAGGKGSRMNNSLPKQFIEIGGTAILIRTIRCFLKYNANMHIIVCIHPEFKEHLHKLLKNSALPYDSIKITEGGETRFDSVKKGLELITDTTAVVGIHDAARPFVSEKTIANCFDTAALKGNAIPCITINESVRQVTGSYSIAVNRDMFKLVQTPQCFLMSKIKAAFEQPYSPAFTDDATVLEAAGESINLVEGNIENIKITTPHDLLIATAFIND